MNNENVKDIVTNAIEALKNDVNNTSLLESEKKALIMLLDNTLTYYRNRKILILNKGGDFCDERIAALRSFIIDIVVKINNALTGELDVHYFIGLMHSKLNEKELKKILKYK